MGGSQEEKGTPPPVVKAMATLATLRLVLYSAPGSRSCLLQGGDEGHGGEGTRIGRFCGPELTVPGQRVSEG